MRTAALLVGGVALAACVRGSPLDDDPLPPLEGGAVTPPGCAYRSVTPIGAEPPTPAGELHGPDPAVRHVHLGFIGDPRTSMVVTWRTRDDITSLGFVRWGRAGALTETAPGYTFRYATALGGVGDVLVRVHEAHLCGLEPDTVYEYQVVSDEAHTSPIYRFRTAPDPALTPDATISIASVGDSRDGYEVWADMVAGLQARAPDLLLFSGDAVTIGSLQDEWEEFFTAGEPLLATTPLVSAHGNHDLNSVNYYAQLAMPGDESTFGFDYGPAHVVVANDSPPLSADLAGRIAQFLDDDLAAHPTAPWKLVTHHRPAYSASLNHGSDATLQAEWVPIFDRHRVDVVLNGHDHDYERTHPLRSGATVASPADGTVYVVSGGAGATLYDNGLQPFTARSAKLHSAVVLRLRAGHLELEAFDDAGAIIDGLVIDKP